MVRDVRDVRLTAVCINVGILQCLVEVDSIVNLASIMIPFKYA